MSIPGLVKARGYQFPFFERCFYSSNASAVNVIYASKKGIKTEKFRKVRSVRTAYNASSNVVILQI